MIPLWSEETESIESRRMLRCPLEDCIFCQKPTNTWHENTNNPICVSCAKVKKVSDIKEDYGQQIRKLKRLGKFNRGDSVRVN